MLDRVPQALGCPLRGHHNQVDARAHLESGELRQATGLGNLEEIWDRNIAPMGAPRGLNNIWTKGGLQYAPPLR